MPARELEKTIADTGKASPTRVASYRPENPVLQKLFVIFFVQIVLLILVSFIRQSGPVFVERYFFGLDFHDFYLGASDLFHHVDPYLRGRLYTPPFSLMVGITLIPLPFGIAVFIQFVVNLGLIFASLIVLARQFDLSPSNKLALLGVAAVFYPVYFVVERGNLDGIMLALLVFGFRSKNRFVQALLLGTSVALKVYSGLILAIMLRRRKNWKIVAGAVLVAAALQLPFLHLAPSFWAALTGRSGFFRIKEDISPAIFLGIFAHHIHWWTKIYFVLWAGSLVYRLVRDRNEDLSRIWPIYAPWMMSFPVMVYPYTGIFALPMLALLAGECQKRSLIEPEGCVVTGVILLGFQGTAWTYAFSFLGVASGLLHLVCAIGTLLIVIGGCGLPNYTMIAENGTEVV